MKKGRRKGRRKRLGRVVSVVPRRKRRFKVMRKRRHLIFSQ